MDRDALPTELDVVFLGGGSAAEASAPRLAEAGLDVLVLEPTDTGGEWPIPTHSEVWTPLLAQVL